MPFMPPISWLRERFYLCEAGVLRHAKNIGRSKKGKPAGRKMSDGYWKVDVVHAGTRKKLGRHRIVWSLHNGRAVPDTREVDHKDTDNGNDHPLNLRAVTERVNKLNKKKKGTGISIEGQRIRSKISVHGKTIHLGMFDCPIKANRAYRQALAGRHPRCGRAQLQGQP